MKWTLTHIEQLKKEKKIAGFTVIKRNEESSNLSAPPKASKYGNKRVEYNGEWFDSIKEKNRYIELLFLLKQGLIGQLQRQVAYELNEGGSHSVKYIADFVYLNAETGETVVEDVKGWRTRTYKKKRKLMLKIWNITILET